MWAAMGQPELVRQQRASARALLFLPSVLGGWSAGFCALL